MPPWEEGFWESSIIDAPRRERRSGAYRQYSPPPLAGSPLALPPETDTILAEAERRIRRVTSASSDLAGISRFLLRSEAIASSRIEGIAPSARQVALAELGQTESVRGLSDQAQMVANNMTVVRAATTQLVAKNTITTSDIVEIHRSLLPQESHHHGLRTVQNWIGGSDWHPLEADFVPAPPGRVPALMDDLILYINGAAHSPVAQAAMAHAQFETVHPFTDGNGRVGRALIHSVLARRGLCDDAILPISLVLSTQRERYVSGLTAYRHDSPPSSREAFAARAQWIRFFAQVIVDACDQAHRISEELAAIRNDWTTKLTASRISRGARPTPRADSATALVLAQLPATPVLTAMTVQRIHGVSHGAAGTALEELCAAGILTTRNLTPARRAYVAPDVLDAITWAERRLASTRFDTRLSPPKPGTPAAPREERP